MTLLDIIILVAVAAGVVMGYRSGFFRQAGSIVAILAAFALGVGLMNAAGAYLTNVLGVPDTFAPIVGFIAAFAAVYLLIVLVSRLAERMMESLKLTAVNRLMGGAVGGLKAALLLSVAFVGLAYVQLPPETARDESRMYHGVAGILPYAWRFVSDNATALDELSRRIERQIEGNTPGDGAPADSTSGSAPDSTGT